MMSDAYNQDTLQLWPLSRIGKVQTHWQLFLHILLMRFVPRPVSIALTKN